MVLGFFRSLAHHGNIQAAADHPSDVSERYALIGDPMIPGSCGNLLKREPVEMSSMEPVREGQRLSPSPAYAETPFSRAMAIRVGGQRSHDRHHHAPMEKDVSPTRARHAPQPMRRCFRLTRKV